MSPLAASLWIGLGVLVWHLPLLLAGEIPWPIAITLIAVSVVYAWLYRQGGSIWPLVLLHFVQNYFGSGYFGAVFAPGDGAVWIGFLTAFYLLWAALIVLRCGPSLGPERQE
jgi:membrane protease YdiL (CAAX protease family)